MKKTVLFFIALAGTCFGQEKAITSSGKNIIMNSDNTWKLDDQINSGLNPAYFKESNNSVSAGIFEKVQLPVKSGDDQTVNVKFSFVSTSSQFKEMTLRKFDDMIYISRNSVLMKLKNKYSFIPREININYSEAANAWSIIWNYTAKNSYGGEVEGMAANLYNNDLQEIDLLDRKDALEKEYLKDKKNKRKSK
jgi:hypothetical protein